MSDHLFSRTGRHRDYCDICRRVRMIERRPEMDYTDDIGPMEVVACDDCAAEDAAMRDGILEPPDAADLGER